MHVSLVSPLTLGRAANFVLPPPHLLDNRAKAVGPVFVRWFSEFGESKWCGFGLVWFVDLWIKTVSQLYTMCSCIRTDQFPKKKSEVVQIINFVRL